MFEGKTYNIILNEMLEQIPNTMDKREGSVIYNGIAPFAMVLSEFYKKLDAYIKELHATTATDTFLDDIVGMFGVKRKVATYSVRKGTFTSSNGTLLDIDIGSRFSIEGITYYAFEKISDGIYQMKCETAGEIGNVPVGEMLPINNISNLGTATLSDILVPGSDTETDEELRARFYNSVNSVAFGGNIADYKTKVKDEVSGVGAVKVIPSWQGGGTVKLIILDNNLNPASSTLIDNVSEVVGENGNGIAPIGHTVTTVAADNHNISISMNITLKESYTESVVKENIRQAINSYFDELKENWEDSNELIVRIIQIESRIATCDGVLDILNLRINNDINNITLNASEVPYLSEVVFN